MNAENKIALALINLTTGSIYLKDGRLFNDDCGELPSVEELAAVVKQNPEEIAEALFNDAVTEFLPMSLNVKTMRRIVSGAGTLADVEELTEARAEASRIVFSIGQELMEEAGEASAEEAAEIILAFARGGYALEEDGFRLIGCPSLVETHQTVVAALDREPEKTFVHLLAYLHELGIREREPATIYSISRQIAGYYHAALNLGLDEMECALKPKTASPAWMKPKRSAPWRACRLEEDALELILRLLEGGKPVFADERFSMSHHEYETIKQALASRTTELARLLADELQRRDSRIDPLLGLDDEIVNRINSGTSTKDDVRKLVEEMGEAVSVETPPARIPCSDIARAIADELDQRDALDDISDELLDRISTKKSNKEDVRKLTRKLVESVLTE